MYLIGDNIYSYEDFADRMLPQNVKTTTEMQVLRRRRSRRVDMFLDLGTNVAHLGTLPYSRSWQPQVLTYSRSMLMRRTVRESSRPTRSRSIIFLGAIPAAPQELPPPPSHQPQPMSSNKKPLPAAPQEPSLAMTSLVRIEWRRLIVLPGFAEIKATAQS